MVELVIYAAVVSVSRKPRINGKSVMKVLHAKCPECGAQMQEGFLLDEGQGTRHEVYWVSGVPEKSVWVGTKLKGKEVWRTVAYRCRDCGYLKSYARQKKE